MPKPAHMRPQRELCKNTTDFNKADCREVIEESSVRTTIWEQSGSNEVEQINAKAESPESIGFDAHFGLVVIVYVINTLNHEKVSR